MGTPHIVKLVRKCYSWQYNIMLNSTSWLGGLWWWGSVLRKPGYLSVNAWLLAFFFPPSFFSLLHISFLLTLSAQFKGSGYEHVQVEQPVLLLHWQWLHRLDVCWLGNGGSGGERLGFSGRTKRWCRGRHRLRREWGCGRWGEKRGYGVRGWSDGRKRAQSVCIIFSWRWPHDFCVVEDWSWEISRGNRKRWGWGVAGGPPWLCRRTEARWVQPGLGALHPTRDLLEQIPCLLLLYPLLLFLLHLS